MYNYNNNIIKKWTRFYYAACTYVLYYYYIYHILYHYILYYLLISLSMLFIQKYFLCYIAYRSYTLILVFLFLQILMLTIFHPSLEKLEIHNRMISYRIGIEEKLHIPPLSLIEALIDFTNVTVKTILLCIRSVFTSTCRI